MKKTGKTLRNLLYAIPIAIASFLPGCEKENYPPEANLEVSPISGEVPLNVRMKVTGEDPDGIQDITQYILNIGGESVRSKTPIDITKTFENTGKIDIYGEVIDSKNHMDKTGISSVEVYRGPYLEQSASLNNDVEINYSATLYKVNNAELKVNREGVLFKTEEIKDSVETGVDYQKTFNYANDRVTKGNYEFVLKSDNLEKKNNVSIPNYKPTITSIAPVNFLEESDSTIILPTPTDKNPEDIANIAYTKATSLDGKTEVTLLTGNKLKIKGLPNQIGNYQIEIEYGSTSGGLEKAILSGNIIEDTRLIINPFISTDANGAAYNALTTKTERDNFIQEKLDEDWVNEIPFSIDAPWNCTHYSINLFVNSKNLGEKIRTISSEFGKDWLYNGYKGNNLDSIYKNHGSLITMGSLGIPMEVTSLIDTSNGYFGHSMNCIITGDNLTKWEDINFIEPAQDAINVQPGQWKIPRECDEIIIAYPYLVEDRIQGNYLKSILLVKFKIENGIPSLIWENNDPDFKIIKQRRK